MKNSNNNVPTFETVNKRYLGINSRIEKMITNNESFYDKIFKRNYDSEKDTVIWSLELQEAKQKYLGQQLVIENKKLENETQYNKDLKTILAYN